ncbi:MAG: tripartite tricarboxylate transporter substrate binding protein, partial [Acetobacteraceae bacterium]|nr:tripartite tricarboxylate transporter substrate binding protein [Acetobacteraceae bacterium]
MPHPTRIARRALVAAGIGLPSLAAAQTTRDSTRDPVRDWPTHAVRFIGLFPPGGGTDILSRIWCARMAEITGQQFIVENRSGSGGNIGTEAIARSGPDGRTIGLASVAPLAISPTLYATLP